MAPPSAPKLVANAVELADLLGGKAAAFHYVEVLDARGEELTVTAPRMTRQEYNWKMVQPVDFFKGLQAAADVNPRRARQDIPFPKVPSLYGADPLAAAQDFVTFARAAQTAAYHSKTVTEDAARFAPVFYFDEMEKAAVVFIRNFVKDVWVGVDFDGATVDEAFRSVFFQELALTCSAAAKEALAAMREDRTKPMAAFQQEFRDLLSLASPVPLADALQWYIRAADGEEDKRSLKRLMQEATSRQELLSVDDLMRAHKDGADAERLRPAVVDSAVRRMER